MIKDDIVHKQKPEKKYFDFKVSLTQTVFALLVTPVVLAFSKAYENYCGPLSAKDGMGYFEFLGLYFYNGFGCIFDFAPESISHPAQQCSFSIIYVLLYCLALIAMHLFIEILMAHKQEDTIRKTMAFAVPITVVAFMVGHYTMPLAIGMTTIDPYCVVALIVCTGGCFLHNWTDEDEEAKLNPKEV